MMKQGEAYWLLAEKECCFSRFTTKMLLKLTLALASFLHLPCNSSAQLNYFALEQIKDLENHTVTSVIDDDFGFMWFGTLEGLIRFDGYKAKRFKNELKNKNSLWSNAIRGL